MTSSGSGRIALVTGATSGIGRATALLLAHRGTHVIATGRNPDALETLAAEAPYPVTTHACDLTDADGRRALVDVVAALAESGLSTLVNAAGIIATGTLESTALSDFDRMMDVNVRVPFDLTRACLPHLERARGSVVNVSSVTGTRAFPGVLSYCVSKAALDQMTRCLALEMASRGVRVNAVNPGVVRTNLHRNGGMGEESYTAFLEHSRQTHPLGRAGEPEEVAELIAFLASDAAAWITGECVAIDGGRAQTCAR